METAVLIAFTLSYEGKTRAVSKFYRELYGYQSYSYYGRYRAMKPCFLDGIRNIRYDKGIYMIRMEDTGRVVSYLEGKGAKVSKWEVIPGLEEKKQLELQAS